MAPATSSTDGPYRLFPSVRLCMFLLELTAAIFVGAGFVSFNFSIVCMVNDTAIAQTSSTNNESIDIDDRCGVSISNLAELDQEEGYNGEFIWDKAIQSNLLAAHSYGAVLANLPSGLISDRFGSKLVIAAGLAINAGANALTPTAAYAGVAWLFIARVFQGVGTAIVWPAAVAMVSNWGASSETSTLLTVISMGSQVGYFLAMLTSSAICDSKYRWPLSFYIWSGLSFVFMIVWILLYTDDPQKCKFISKEELNYLQKNKMRKGRTGQSLLRIPWKRILCSPCTIAIYVCQFSSTWATNYIAVFMPTYSKEVLQLAVQNNGFNSSLTALSQCVGRLIFGPMGDKLSFCGRSKTFNIKIFTAICTVLPCVCFILLGFLDCRHTVLAVSAFCLASFFLSSSSAGYPRGGVLMAPGYAGLISSLSATCGYVGSIVMPYAVAGMAKHATVQEWKHTAFLTAAIMLLSFIQYQLCGSAEEKTWANEQKPATRKVYAIEEGNKGHQSDSG